MSWINDTQKAINYIEDNLLEINAEEVASRIYSSSDHFQRMFLIVTGFTVSEYIRNRRLSLAGRELADSKSKIRIIDVALKYGYETHESFTKAFTRFHGFTPSKARSSENRLNRLKCFIPLEIDINIKGGFVMSRKIIPNVEKLYENKAENYMFPSCMRSSMYALGESREYDFLFFAGACGDLFTQVWREPKWQYNSEYSINNPDAVRSAFAACGYGYEYIPRDAIKQDKANIRKRLQNL